MSTPIQGILRGLKDTRVSFVLMVLAYWGGCFPMSLFLDHVMGWGADSYWLGLDFGVGCSALLMVLRLLYVERVMDGRPVLSFSFFRDMLFSEPKVNAYAPAMAAPENMCEVTEENIRQAESLLALLAEMEEKISVLMQSLKEAEIDIFVENRRVLPIRLSLLTDLHLCILGHATRAYVP